MLQLFAQNKIEIGNEMDNNRQAKVDYDAFEELTHVVREHRKSRLINLDDFNKMSKEDSVIILDTRSDIMYARKHIKGAIHLNFSDFTQENLARIIPSPDYKILIYCNNNFEGDEVNFASKIAMPKLINKDIKPISLALNIPTYINLYGYGYFNVYELSELIYPYDSRIEFEGSEINK
jgi:hypothetical protein